MSEIAPAVRTRWPIALPGLDRVALVVAFVLVRLLLITRYRIDSDETQHLHVAWAWTHGLVQYRDVFDNHMPLFHLLFAPFVLLAGERPSTLLAARLAMLPLFGAIAWLTYRIARTCLSQRAAAIATIAGCLAPDFFLCSIEVRPDVMWTASWVVSIAVLAGAPLTPRSAAAAGLALGLAAAFSAKTSLLAATLAPAAIATAFITRMELRPIVSRAASFIAAAVVPVAIIAAYFASIGAWRSFVYCTISHNVVASQHPERLLILPLAAVLIVAGTRTILRDQAPLPVMRRRVFLFLIASIYAALLTSLWPVIETEHWLPFYPVAAAGFASLVTRRARQVAFAMVAIELVWIMRASTPWIDHASESLALIDDATRLTSPGERVVDLKGEIVFRPRASYWVFEKLTRRAIAEGRINDTLAADAVRSGAMVAVPDSHGFPRHGRSFLLRNFISVGCVRVAGKLVRAGEPFAIEVPGSYALVTGGDRVDADLDGVRYTAPRPLARGRHIVSVDGPLPAPMALVWERAAADGFSPFAPDRRCDNAMFRIEERNGLTHPPL